MNSAPHRSDVTSLAGAFVAVLKEWLTQDEWAEMRTRNGRSDYSNCCASHDFCDANMAMSAAFGRAFHREPAIYDRADGSEGDDVPLWNAAWAEAAVRHLRDGGEQTAEG
jgi:hypothetical protein